MAELTIYNTLSRKKELFTPLRPPFVGLYVCGPTVYGDAHLGHARSAINFDLLFRYLNHLGYKVRYVRNITDVGHLENDADQGEDKIGKKAQLEQIEPMEVVQRYTDRYHRNMEQMNVLKPSIEPRASGHIIEQQQMVQKILDAGYAYESNGSVYFDVESYHRKHTYGKLSGRVLEDLMSSSRELDGQEEKRKSFDFALWKKAEPSHLMHWPSPWSEGFPGWHLECSAMSTKYLGSPFDIHGGGMDLLFPHHECEIAQSTAAEGHEAVRYWMHNNMITINGQKMGKSLGNFITLDELFSGQHAALEQAYSPLTIRFFVLQAHYRSTLDFSNEALQAAEKGLIRLQNAWKAIASLPAGDHSDFDPETWSRRCYDALNDDLNTPIAIAHLFDAVKFINLAIDGKASLTAPDRDKLDHYFDVLAGEVLGLTKPGNSSSQNDLTPALIEMLLQMRLDARKNKDFATSDRIRDALAALGIEVKDRKDGSDWSFMRG